MGYDSVSTLAMDIGEWAGASNRQLDYWARCGVFGDEFTALGSGSKRPWWKPGVADAVWACARLADLGAGTRVLQIVAPVVLARPVVDGEWLIVTQDGARRHDHFCFDDLTAREPAWVIPLRSFASVTPTDGDGAPADPASAGVRDAAVPAAAASSSPAGDR